MVPDKNDKSILLFPFRLDNPGYQGITFITFMKIICDNPTCPCTFVFFNVKEADEKGKIIEPVKSHSFVIDIVKKKLKKDNYLDVPDWDISFGRLFLSEMTDDIYSKLIKTFHTYKQDLAENANIDGCEFDFSGIEYTVENDGYMVDYQELFPFCITFKVEYDNYLYVVADQYCLCSTCHCTHTGINIVELAKEKKDKGKPIAVITYDYIKQKWTLDNSYEQPEYSVNQVMDKLIEENKNINKILRNRHKRLRQIYSRFRSKNSIKRQAIKTSKRIGRNEPCPCGSGKKYKKCCGK